MPMRSRSMADSRMARTGPAHFHRAGSPAAQPHEKLGGLYHLPRMVDKARLFPAGKLPGYNYLTFGFDKTLLDFLCLEGAVFEQIVAKIRPTKASSTRSRNGSARLAERPRHHRLQQQDRQPQTRFARETRRLRAAPCGLCPDQKEGRNLFRHHRFGRGPAPVNFHSSHEQDSPLSVPEAIHQRRTTRKFKPDPIPEATLKELIALTLAAPSSFNMQPWRVILVDDPKQKEALARPRGTSRRSRLLRSPLFLPSAFAGGKKRWIIRSRLHRSRRMVGKDAGYFRGSIPGFQDGLGDKQREYAIKDAIIAATHCALAAESLGSTPAS